MACNTFLHELYQIEIGFELICQVFVSIYDGIKEFLLVVTPSLLFKRVAPNALLEYFQIWILIYIKTTSSTRIFIVFFSI